ncbi:MAG: hypothetical protein AABY93_04775 [Bacteroidota bacterium]
MSSKKRIIYLFGSGATHATINAIDLTKNLLTSDIRDKIREKEFSIKDKEIPTDVWNELMDAKVDIEHLISILETNYHYHSAQIIRKQYHEAILNLSKEVIANINKPKFKPNLYSILFDLHKVKKLKEQVTSIFTLNYEDLLEKSLKAHLDIEADYLIASKKSSRLSTKIPVLKLHGSFNWLNIRPILVGNAHKIKESEALWIPPGVDKKRENYPFNFLWGRAFSFLTECDILRVIGCSLSRNDWGLIPMIYTAMRLTKVKPSFEIEIIDFFDKGKKIKESYPYLNIKNIIEIPEFEKYIRDYFTIDESLPIPSYAKDYISSENTKLNIFELWLKSKSFELEQAGIDFSKRKYISSFAK